jgi:SpoU rRNA methylase family enzyme
MRSKLCIIPVICYSFLLGACAHVYHAPDNAKLEASTARLSNAVVKATNAVTKASGTAERAKSQVDAAQKAADVEAVTSATVLNQLDDLLKVLPPELKSKGDALKTAVVQDQSDIGEIVTHVNGAQKEQSQLTKDLLAAADANKESAAADAQVQTDKAEYYAKTDKLAATATKLSSKLAWYERHWWGSWIALGAGVIACIIFAALKWGVKWSAKGARAVAKVESGGIL